MLLGDERRELSLILKRAMEEDGIGSAEELARRIGLPAQRIRSYLRMECKPRLELTKIAHYLGLTTDQLLDKINRYRPADVLEAIYKLPSEERLEIQEKLDQMKRDRHEDNEGADND